MHEVTILAKQNIDEARYLYYIGDLVFYPDVKEALMNFDPLVFYYHSYLFFMFFVKCLQKIFIIF